MNYDLILKEIINDLDYTPKLLLHSCCAPCSSSVISYLTQFFDITIFYYNPNIDTEVEYQKRKEEQIRFLKEFKSINKLDFLDCDYEKNTWLNKVKGFENEPERGARCSICFELRLDATAQKARELNYDFFGTTLTVSPYKNSKLINEIGKSISEKYNINYLYSDFKKNDGYKKSIELSKLYGLYRQDYCGCEFSKRSNLNE